MLNTFEYKLPDIVGMLKELFFWKTSERTPIGGVEFASRKNPELRILVSPDTLSDEPRARFYFSYSGGARLIYELDLEDLSFSRLETLVEYALANPPKHAAEPVRITIADLYPEKATAGAAIAGAIISAALETSRAAAGVDTELAPGSLRGIYAAQIAAEGHSLPVEVPSRESFGWPGEPIESGFTVKTLLSISNKNRETWSALAGMLDKFPRVDLSKVTPFENSEIRSLAEAFKKQVATLQERQYLEKLGRLQELEARLKVVCSSPEVASRTWIETRAIAENQNLLPVLDCFIGLLEKVVELKLSGAI